MSDRTCSVDGCDKPVLARGWCSAHYRRWRIHGTAGADVPVRPKAPRVPRHAPDAQCIVDGCTRSPRGGGRGWCKAHYSRWLATGDVRADIPPKSITRNGPGAKCAVDGCERWPDGGNGWCEMHYQRWRKRGDPLAVSVIIGDDQARFESYVDRSGGPGACHLWTGRPNADGYGQISIGAGLKSAHAVAWEFENGPRPAGAELDHECHNQAIRDGLCRPGKCAHRLCCNLRHLVLRANRKEHAAATSGNALRRPSGRKLTEAQARELRSLLANAKDRHEVSEIARRFGISHAHASRVKRGKSWARLSAA